MYFRENQMKTYFIDKKYTLIDVSNYATKPNSLVNSIRFIFEHGK